MNKKGVTIIELLISISLITVIILLLVRVMFSFNKINNDESYASSDEISRTEIIKVIESDFLELELNGLSINNNIITFIYQAQNIDLIIDTNKITYNGEIYSLKSNNASYDTCVNYTYLDLDNDYYYLKIVIPVLINEENTTSNDDITLSYIGLKNETTNYILNYTCNNN